MEPKRVLIAHQSTIPHYRVRFYELLNQLRPSDWTFDVVYDTAESSKPSIYFERVDHKAFGFPILDASTTTLTLGGKRLIWQHFWRRAGNYDVLVTDTHLSNLTYPALLWHQFRGRKRVLWGHARDRNNPVVSSAKRMAESAKRAYVRGCDGFFAYTPGERQAALNLGVAADRITVVNNTIDTIAERARFLEVGPSRDAIRQGLGVLGRKVLLFVGRLIPDKRIAFLAESFRLLHADDPSWHLIVAGTGPYQHEIDRLREQLGSEHVTSPGAVSEPNQLARLFVASDLFAITGAVGLAPLQALCYDLTPVAFDLPSHGPEIEYLNERNSFRMSGETSAKEFAAALPAIYCRAISPEWVDGLYGTVAHLTLENMAKAFCEGMESVLRKN
jgi:L-malate glycosyltransferase